MNDRLLDRLGDPRSLTARDGHTTFEALIAPATDDSRRIAILHALARRTPSAVELTRFVRELHRRAIPFAVPRGDRPIDLCGSGGARTPSFNISTVSAFVVAAAGVPVAKHGNRSSRGPCGSSDLLEALGLPVTTSLAFGRVTYQRFRLAFLHAPLYHPATKAVAAARRAVGAPTVFNKLGPLSNPARITFQLVGVADLDTARCATEVLRNLGRRRAMAVTSVEGCDEFSPKSATRAVVWTGRRLVDRTFFARDLLPPEDRVGDWGALRPELAAEEARRILAGGGGARRGSVLLTAGAALWLAGAAGNPAQGVARAREALDSGRAEAILEQMVLVGRRYRRPRRV
ncbi:MAG TPA: anthranilate phosphoribosyltransferase [Thermoplasmata archaeon]|nr:anthranilate phosphoribosyltransferase [Thermoplasmata archaeon]